MEMAHRTEKFRFNLVHNYRFSASPFALIQECLLSLAIRFALVQPFLRRLHCLLVERLVKQIDDFSILIPNLEAKRLEVVFKRTRHVDLDTS